MYIETEMSTTVFPYEKSASSDFSFQKLSCNDHLQYVKCCSNCRSINLFFSDSSDSIEALHVGSIICQQFQPSTNVDSNAVTCPVRSSTVGLGHSSTALCSVQGSISCAHSDNNSNKSHLLLSISSSKRELIHFLSPNGSTALVESPFYPEARIRPVPVYFASGYSIASLNNTKHTQKKFRFVHIVPLKGDDDSIAHCVVYIGSLGLLGGGSWFSKRHRCENHIIYFCDDCGFSCPDKECVDCCTHKTHVCNQQIKRRKQALKEKERTNLRDTLIHEELKKESSTFNDFFENLSSTDEHIVLNTIDCDENVNRTLEFVTSVSEPPEEVYVENTSTQVESSSCSTKCGYLPVHSEKGAYPPVLKFPRLGGVFRKISLSHNVSPQSKSWWLSGGRDILDPSKPRGCFGDMYSFTCEKYITGFDQPKQFELYLLNEFISNPISDCLSVETFLWLWQKMCEVYPNCNERIKFLQLLLHLKFRTSLSLISICNMLDLILKNTWDNASLTEQSFYTLFRLKQEHIRMKLQNLIHLSNCNREKLLHEIDLVSWDSEVCEIFGKCIQNEPLIESVLDFVFFVQKYEVPDAILISVIMSELYVESRECKTEIWKHHITYQLMGNSLILPQPIIHQISPYLSKMINLNVSPGLLYNELVMFFVGKCKNSFKKFRQCTHALEIICNYQVGSQICESALKIFSSCGPSNLRYKIDQLIVSEIFQSKCEYDVNKMFDLIVKNMDIMDPNFSSLLKIKYDLVIRAVNKPFRELDSFGMVSSWNKVHVSKWATFVLNKKYDVSLIDTLAILLQAMFLHSGFTLRPVQILSLLVLLHPEKTHGRLAQINTGEGKSTIVAILAAVHALSGKKVDVITSSTELAIREVKKLEGFFKMLKLSVSENCSENNNSGQNVYNCDVVYGTASNFIGDILRKEFLGNDVRSGRLYDIVIVDEVDAMFFDNRSCNVRLSQRIPGMNHLEIVLGAIWVQVHRIAHHIIQREGKTYFIADEFECNGGNIKLESGEPWNAASSEVENQREFIVEHTQRHIEQLIRKLGKGELQKYRQFQNLQYKIHRQVELVSSNDTSKKNEIEKLKKDLQTLPWVLEEHYPVLEIPEHLRSFAKSQLPFWIRNAVDAACFFIKDAHYTVQNDRIAPIQYDENGELQLNLVWSDGLAQFLQIKEGLPVDAESISTNYLSNVSFFKRYGNNIYGVTGTLGEQNTQDFLCTTYRVDIALIPPHVFREVRDNYGSPYLCKELTPITVTKECDWYETIAAHSLFHAKQERGVLIICKYILQVKKLVSIIKSRYHESYVFAYTGENEFLREMVNCGEIIVATNIAGRGTDLETSHGVESRGGLYVCITFLPSSYRVEMQNVGRTARGGKKGMAQLIILGPANSNMRVLKKLRNERETNACERAKNDVERVLIQDELFTKFCSLESSLLPSFDECTMESMWIKLESDWKNYYEQKAYAIQDQLLSYKARLQKEMRRNMSHNIHRANNVVTCDDEHKINDAIERQLAQDLAKQKVTYKKELLETFCNTQAGNVPVNLLQCLREGKPYKANRKRLASEFHWGTFERQAVEERWALWLRSKHFECNENLENAAIEFRDEFQKDIESDANEDQLIKNPYYYVLKGNDFYTNAMLVSKILGGKRNEILKSAINCYDKAIILDCVFSAYARYNKACALLSHHWNMKYHDKAVLELLEVRNIIDKILRPALLTFNIWVGLTGIQLKTSQHIQHQLNILNNLHISAKKSIAVLREAEKNNLHVKVTTESLTKVLNVSSEDHSKAIRQAVTNGLTHFFSLDEVAPFQLSSVIGIALFGIAQIIVGSLLTTCGALPLGIALITLGVFHLTCSFEPIITDKLSGGVYAINKASSLALSVLSFGWNCIKSSIDALKSTVRVLKKSTQEVAMFACRKVGILVTNFIINSEDNNESELSKCFSQVERMNREKSLCENFEKEIICEVKRILKQELPFDPLLMQGLGHDQKSDVNYWQQTFIKEGEKIISSNRFSNMEKKFQKHLSKEIKQQMCSTSAGNLSEAMREEIGTLMKEFLREFRKVVDEKHRNDVTGVPNDPSYFQKAMKFFSSMIDENLSTNTHAVERVSEGRMVDFQGFTKCDLDSQNSPRNSGTDRNKTKRLFSPLGSSKDDPEEFLVELFSRHISQSLCENVRPKVFAHSIDQGMMNMSKVLNETKNMSDTIKKQLDASVASFFDTDDKDEDTPTKEPMPSSAGNEYSPKWYLSGFSTKTQNMIHRIRENIPLNRPVIFITASVLERPFLVFDAETGKLVHMEGSKHSSSPVMLKVSAAPDLTDYCMPLDDSICVEKISENGFIDAVWAQLSSKERESLHDINGLKEEIILKIQMDPSSAHSLFKSFDEFQNLYDKIKNM